METMKAIGFRNYGDPNVLEQLEVDIPSPTPDSIRIKIVASGVNPADSAIRKGNFKLFIRLQLPFIPGSDIAGIVTDVGADVTNFNVGDRVFAMSSMQRGGAYAEYAVVKADYVARIPDNLSYCEAGAVPLAGLTAWQGLIQQAQLKAGQSILINGASGGVGTFATQIARAVGAHVTTVCSTKNMDLVKSLGVENVIDYSRQSLDELNEHYDVVFDVFAYMPLRTGIQLTKRGGIFLSLNPGVGNPITKLMAGIVRRKVRSFLVQPNGQDLQALSNWITKGQIKPVITETHPLIEAIVAHHHIETKHTSGKIVLIVDESLAQTK